MNPNEKRELKLVVSYDRNRNEYSIAAHNQGPEAAERFAAQWEKHLRPDCSFILLPQTKEHQTEEPQDCRTCRETVTRSAHLEPNPKFVRRKP